jgi:hypothetical protein
MVLKNQVILGSVNAAPVHYKNAVRDLVKINERWRNEIGKMITGKFKFAEYEKAFGSRSPQQIKTIIEW